MSQSAKLVLKGTKYYSASREYSSGRLRKGSPVYLVHTPYNSSDENAVAAFLARSGAQLGYLSRDIAPKYSRLVDDNRITSAKVHAASRASNGSIRVEILVNIGQARDGEINSVTGTTQKIPSDLEPALQKDKIAKQREAEERVNARRRREEEERKRCESALAAAKKELTKTKLRAARDRLRVDEIDRLKHKLQELENKGTRNRWIGSAAGIVIGAMAGGPPGALVGGIAGLVTGSMGRTSDEIQKIKQQLTEHESNLRGLAAAENVYRNAAEALRRAGGDAPDTISIDASRKTSRTERGPVRRGEAYRRFVERKPVGNDPYVSVRINCASCGAIVTFTAPKGAQRHKCPQCGFAHPRAD